MKYAEEVKHIFEMLPQKSCIEKVLIRDFPDIHHDVISEWGIAHSFPYKTFSEALRYYMTGEIFVCQYGNRKTMRSINSPLMCKPSCECVKEKRKATNVHRHGTEYPSQLETTKEKMKQTNVGRYGVEHVSQLDATKEKMKQTNMRNHGVEYVSQLETVKEKSRHTTIEKYGVEHASQSPTTKEKTKQTVMDRYGVEHVSQLDSVKEKAKQTNFEKYGFEYASQSRIIRDRIKQTTREHHGVDHVLQSPEIRERMKQTNLERYGVEYSSQSQVVKDKVKHTFHVKYDGKRPHSLPNDVFEDLMNADIIKGLYEAGGVKRLCEEYGIAESTANKFLRLNGIHRNGSSFEKEIAAYLDELNVEYVMHDRTILGGREIDIFIPSHNVGIECNGAYWHSEQNGKFKHYHYEKTRQCSEKNIKLLHILDVHWDNSQDIYKSLIATSLKKSIVKIYARKCVVGKITAEDSKKFLDANHRQGYCVAKHRYGLFYNGELVQVMTFGSHRFTAKYQYELLRLCTMNHAVVIGGASKLFKTFLTEHSPVSIGSYCDISLNSGTVYRTLEFKFVGITPPSFYYIDRNCNLYSRIQFQKHKLRDKLPIYDESKTEWENMKMNGYDRVWDCGNSSWCWGEDALK